MLYTSCDHITSDDKVEECPICLNRKNCIHEYYNVDPVNPKERMWRAIFSIIAVEKNSVWIIIPSWNSKCAIEFDKNQFPKELVKRFKKNYIFFGHATIGCDSPKEMKISSDYEYE